MGGGGGGLGMSNPPMTMSSLPPMSVSQPLPSNVLSKQQTSLEQQYMQQSSQIFVFSTQWANKAAQAVMQQEFPSIICWHENQAETKKHLSVRSTKTLLTELSLLFSSIYFDCKPILLQLL